MARSVAEYYATNYTRCQVDESYFATWQGFAYSSHAMQFVALPCQLLAFYMLIRKTPKSMSSVKNPLIFSHFWITILDLELCTLITPYFFIPMVAMDMLGLLSYLHVPTPVQVAIALMTAFAMAISVIYLFESRSSLITQNPFKITRQSTRIIYYTTNFILDCFSLFILVLIPDQESGKLAVLRKLPCPSEIFFTSSTSFAFFDDPFWQNFWVLYACPALLLSALIQMSFFSTCCIYYLFLKPSKMVSDQTRRIQKRFFIGIVIQFCIPSVLVAFPYLIIVILQVIGNSSQAALNVLILICGLHGTVESITLVTIHQAYRQALIQLVTRKNVVVPSGLTSV